MKKLSEILLEQRTIEVQTPPLHPIPTLVLFNDVLDPDKVIHSPEIEKLTGHFFGTSALSVVQVDDPAKLHDWFREEQYKTSVQGRSMIYPVKAKFEDWAVETHSDEYSGPLYIQVFTPSGAIFDVLTITCYWGDGLFLNDYYVVGAIVDTEDLQAILGKV